MASDTRAPKLTTSTAPFYASSPTGTFSRVSALRVLFGRVGCCGNGTCSPIALRCITSAPGPHEVASGPYGNRNPPVLRLPYCALPIVVFDQGYHLEPEHEAAPDRSYGISLGMHRGAVLPPRGIVIDVLIQNAQQGVNIAPGLERVLWCLAARG
jgi:hypothetical protein